MQPLRRVITGNNAEGRSVVIADERASDGVIWHGNTKAPLGSLPGNTSVVDYLLPTTAAAFEPSPGGHYLYYGSFAPWSESKSEFANGAMPGFDEEGFHRTETIDYLLILNGEVELLLDNDRVLLRAGDLVIQRNTRHAWHNPTDRPTHYLAVTIKPAAHA